MRQNAAMAYEQAFAEWLGEHKAAWQAIDQSRRKQIARQRIKSFDFAFCADGRSLTLADVKGRIFRGDSLAGKKGLQCWVTQDDVQGLTQWQAELNRTVDTEAVFVFAYLLEQADIDTDGLAVYEYQGNRYVFLAVRLDDYRQACRPRSARWNTVFLSTAQFRQLAVPAETLFTNIKVP